MSRLAWQRTGLVFALLLPVLAVFISAQRGDAQPGRTRMEMQWKCSKCGGNLGNGVNPPSSCPRCGVKLRAIRHTAWDMPNSNNPPSRSAEASKDSSSPWGKGIAIAVVGLSLLVLGVLITKDWGPGQVAHSGQR